MAAADWIQLLSVIVSVVSAIVAAIAAAVATARSRRREIYGDAYKAVMEWTEMPFRTVRSVEGESKELRSRFHQLQESIFFYQGWIATESKAMSQSYEDFVTVIKKVTGPLIKEAERQIGVPKAPGALNKKMDKDMIAAASEAFWTMSGIISPCGPGNISRSDNVWELFGESFGGTDLGARLVV